MKNPQLLFILYFFKVYLFIYGLQISILSWIMPDSISDQIDRLHSNFFVWFNKNIYYFSDSVPQFGNGSGDTIIDYIKIFEILLFSLIVVVFLRIKKIQISDKWFNFVFKWFAALMFINYGSAKMFPLQFSQPSQFKLIEPIGELSPMGLAWTFMGFSTPYQIIIGFLEFIPGLLLLIPRFVTLGSLIGFAIMSNVFLMNLFFDIPVKLLSFHILISCFFLLFYDRIRLINLFILNKSTEPLPSSPYFESTHKNKIFKWVQISVGLFFIGYILHGDFKTFNQADEISKIDSLWKINSATLLVNNQKENLNWKRILRPNMYRLVFQNESGQFIRFKIENYKEKDSKKLILIDQDNKEIKAEMTLLEINPNELHISGTYKNQIIEIKAERESLPPSRLMSRGFRWINEEPYNR